MVASRHNGSAANPCGRWSVGVASDLSVSPNAEQKGAYRQLSGLAKHSMSTSSRRCSTCCRAPDQLGLHVQRVQAEAKRCHWHGQPGPVVRAKHLECLLIQRILEAGASEAVVPSQQLDQSSFERRPGTLDRWRAVPGQWTMAAFFATAHHGEGAIAVWRGWVVRMAAQRMRWQHRS